MCHVGRACAFASSSRRISQLSLSYPKAQENSRRGWQVLPETIPECVRLGIWAPTWLRSSFWFRFQPPLQNGSGLADRLEFLQAALTAYKKARPRFILFFGRLDLGSQRRLSRTTDVCTWPFATQPLESCWRRIDCSSACLGVCLLDGLLVPDVSHCARDRVLPCARPGLCICDFDAGSSPPGFVVQPNRGGLDASMCQRIMQ